MRQRALFNLNLKIKRELPAKYSPFNQHPNGSSKLGQNPISEEPSQYDGKNSLTF